MLLVIYKSSLEHKKSFFKITKLGGQECSVVEYFSYSLLL